MVRKMISKIIRKTRPLREKYKKKSQLSYNLLYNLRTICIMMNKCGSKMDCDIPQGSGLGPVLFHKVLPITKVIKSHAIIIHVINKDSEVKCIHNSSSAKVNPDI